MHLTVQSFCFILFPAITFGIIQIAKQIFNNNDHEAVFTGIIILSCMPPTISSGPLFSKATEGDFFVVTFNFILGNILGIFCFSWFIIFVIF